MAEEEVYTNEEGEETFVFSTVDLTTMVQMRIIPLQFYHTFMK